MSGLAQCVLSLMAFLALTGVSLAVNAGPVCAAWFAFCAGLYAGLTVAILIERGVIGNDGARS